MIWIDYIITAVVGFFCLINWIRGFIYGAFSFVVWICSFFITSHYYNYFSIWFTGLRNELVRNGASVMLMFIMLLIIGSILKQMLSQLVNRIGLSGIDRILGFTFGALYGVVVIIAVLVILDTFTGLLKSEDWKKSKFSPYFNFIIKWFFDYLKNSSSDLYLKFKFHNMD